MDREVSRFVRSRTDILLGEIGPWPQRVCGWFLLYVIVGGLLGFAVATPIDGAIACWPHASIFGLLHADCQADLLRWFWTATVEIPRAILLLPAVFISNIGSVLAGTEDNAINLAKWLLLLLLLAFIAFLGVRFWQKQNQFFAAGILASLAGQLIALRIFS